MAIKFSFNGSDLKAKAELGSIVDKMGPALVQKMTYLMTRLQEKAREGTEIQRVRESIRNPRAEVVGTAIVGHLDWGGPMTEVQYKGGKKYDLALIFEYGTKTHAVNPLGGPGTSGTRSHEKGASRRFGANILVWPTPYSKGQYGGHVFTRYAFPKGIQNEGYMRDAIDSIRGEFVEELMATVSGAMKRR